MRACSSFLGDARRAPGSSPSTRWRHRVLLAKAERGFVIATPVGLVVAAFFAAASALPRRGGAHRLRPRTQRWLRSLVLIAIASLGDRVVRGGASCSRTNQGEEAPLIARLLSPLAIVLYGFAAVRYLQLYDRRRRLLPLAIAVAFVLLAEAMVAIAFGTQLARDVVGVARVDGARVRDDHVGRARPVPARALGHGRLRRCLSRADARTDRSSRTLMRCALLTTAIQNDAPLAPVIEDLRSQGFSSDEVAVAGAVGARAVPRRHRCSGATSAPGSPTGSRKNRGSLRLGGQESEVSVMFADLAGFTSFSEGRSPGEVIDMVNAYWERAVPMVVEEGGFIERFAGDAILVLFNALRRPTRPSAAGLSSRRSRCATRPSRRLQLILGGRGSGSV